MLGENIPHSQKAQITNAPEYANAERQVKHIALGEAIERLESVTMRLMDLRAKITGEGCGESNQVQAPRPVPTMIMVLEHGPEEIHDHMRKQNDLISDIESLLF